MANEPNVLKFRYTFGFKNGREKTFECGLDKDTLTLVKEDRPAPPFWTRLGHCQCPNCPLAEDQHPFCPVAVNLSELIPTFSDAVSHDPVSLTIETEARNYTKETTMQKGVSSLIGLIMVTSGCPVLDKLKPMVRHHLPFANLEETQYRALSMYLLAQYFIYKKGGKPDWDLKELVRIYDEVRIVNKAFAARLTTAADKDAVTNAVVILNTFADSVVFSIDKNVLHKIEKLFSAYL